MHPSQYLTGSQSFWSLALVIFLRYFVLALLAFLVFYVLKKEAWTFKRIQQKFPMRKDYLREVAYSVATTLIFAVIGYLVFVTPFVKLTQVYYDFDQFGTGYFWFSVVLMILVHDTYFYWTHWLMHRKSVYRYVHRVHHLSTNPSPWAAMAFHPLEAVVEAGVIVIIPFLFPVHPLAIGVFLLFMMVYNVYGHLGYELYPKGFSRSWVGKWVNTSVNHNMHHQQFNGNYGLYFLFWDRLMGTIQSSYDKKFDELQSRRKTSITSLKDAA
ncbi:MAG TPA: sterol desaturase family protein [Chryseosolibacter sp.]|nr:sterol desaturase family protein [Chryseosolibacter sp.]